MSKAAKKTLAIFGGSGLGVALWVYGIVWSLQAWPFPATGWTVFFWFAPVILVILIIIFFLIGSLIADTYRYYDYYDNPQNYTLIKKYKGHSFGNLEPVEIKKDHIKITIEGQ